MKKSAWQISRDNAANLKKYGRNAVRLVLVSHSWNGKLKLTVKGVFPAGDEGKRAAQEMLAASQRRLAPNGAFCCVELGDNRVLGPRQFAALEAKIAAQTAANRKKGAKKAAATRKKRGPDNFILCRSCGAKSKKLYSEMGGLQTRKCQNGHVFEYDKWIADRGAMALIFNGVLVPESAYNRPKR